MYCHNCQSKYSGHFNSKYCSQNCRQNVKTKTNKKYYENNIKKDININSLDNEQWKEIQEYENLYWVSNFGRVKSKIRKGGGGLMKQNLGKNGYFTVTLRNKGEDKRCLVSRLVAESFVYNPNNFTIVDHIDRNRTNNVYTNLRWVNDQQNCLNKESKGGLYTTKDKRNITLANGTLKTYIYTYYRVFYTILNEDWTTNRINKRFKSKDKAEQYLKLLQSKYPR